MTTSTILIVPFGDPNPRLQAKDKVDEVALCDDIERALTQKHYWGRHLWARGYFTVTSGNITDEMINEYINEQEGDPVGDDSRFQIDST